MTTRQLIIDAALALAALNGAVGLYGAVLWYTSRPNRTFWICLRGAQAAAIAYALLVGGVYLAGSRPSGSLFYLYALLPLAVGFVAEQMRVVAAEQVLEHRGLRSAQEVGDLPAQEQQQIVLAIMRRETGVMTLAALVVCFLALRAAGTW